MPSIKIHKQVYYSENWFNIEIFKHQGSGDWQDMHKINLKTTQIKK